MTIPMICAGIVLCVVFSAFFSASEMSFSSCNTIRLENAEEDGDKRAGKALKITERFDDALSTILIGNNLVNIAASSLASLLVINTLGSNYAWVSTVGITLIVIIFGETIPKITAKKAANRVALRNAPVISLLMIIFYPLIRLTVFLIRLLLRGIKDDEPEDTGEAVEELQSIIETAEDEEVLDEDRSELVQAAIDFSDISAGEVMTARVDMDCIDIDDSWEEILRITEQTTYSRIPVYEGRVDNVIGVLYLNHFLKALTDEEKPDLRALLMEPCFIYKTTKLPAVLKELKKARQHLAIVTDEYGGTLGVISMEDVLEQIVGEIWDETDTVEEEVVEGPEGEYELDGDMTVYDFLELLELPEETLEDVESETVGGWIIESLGHFPKEGEYFIFEEWTVSVLAMDGRRVDRVLVKRQQTDAVQSE